MTALPLDARTDDDIELTVTGIVRDEGTIVVFRGETADEEIDFAVDHRSAQWLANGLADDDVVPVVVVAPWQIVSRRKLVRDEV